MKLPRIVTLLALVSQVVLFGCKKSESTPISNVPPELKNANGWNGQTTVTNLAILGGGTTLPGTCTNLRMLINFKQGQSQFTQLQIGSSGSGCTIQSICNNANSGSGNSYYDGAFASRIEGNNLILEHTPDLTTALSTCREVTPSIASFSTFSYANRAQGYQLLGLPTQTTITLNYALSNNNNTLTLTVPGTNPAVTYVLQRQ